LRQMTLVAFLQAQNCTNFAASWRHPDSRTDSASPDFYQHIGRVLEAGKFHLGFFDDRLAMPDMLGGNHEHTVEGGIRCVKMDPITVLMAMGMATEKLGLGSTYSTTYYEPFHVARVFQSLDLMTKGRAAWNVVTSLNDSEAMNMGRSEVVEHDLRYDRADEFLEIVLGHWNSWEDDAILNDKVNNRFADPKKVHRLDYEGQYYKSRGPFTVPRSSQGHPVLIQAGQSGRGLRFAARWAELVFVSYPSLEKGRAEYAAFKENIANHGRDPDKVSVAALAHCVVAETRTEAEDKRALIDTLPTDLDQLSLLSEALNFDFASRGIDEPLSTDELDGMQGIQGLRDRVLESSGKTNPTPREFMKFSGRGLLHRPWVGSAKDVADTMEEWFTTGACDGFVIAATHVPGSYEDFVKFVVPELQRRGIYHKDYAGATLRENLGLDRPTAKHWHLPTPSGGH
jgi:FMN-dependent oxidoreductase (nitrilotriacetate monooxygenase family)